MVDTATWNGKLYSAPFNTNTQLLWYRKDLVRTRPRRGSEMIAMASALAKQGKPHYIEIQGAQYEGYTVWFNTLVNSAGGQIVNDNGRAVTLEPVGRLALDTIHALANSPAVDPSLANQMEDQTRLQFEAGRGGLRAQLPLRLPVGQGRVPDIFKNMALDSVPDGEAGRAPARHHRRHRPGRRRVLEAQAEAFDAIQCLRSPSTRCERRARRAAAGP